MVDVNLCSHLLQPPYIQFDYENLVVSSDEDEESSSSSSDEEEDKKENKPNNLQSPLRLLNSKCN